MPDLPMPNPGAGAVDHAAPQVIVSERLLDPEHQNLILNLNSELESMEVALTPILRGETPDSVIKLRLPTIDLAKTSLDQIFGVAHSDLNRCEQANANANIRLTTMELRANGNKDKDIEPVELEPFGALEDVLKVWVSIPHAPSVDKSMGLLAKFMRTGQLTRLVAEHIDAESLDQTEITSDVKRNIVALDRQGRTVVRDSIELLRRGSKLVAGLAITGFEQYSEKLDELLFWLENIEEQKVQIIELATEADDPQAALLDALELEAFVSAVARARSNWSKEIRKDLPGNTKRRLLQLRNHSLANFLTKAKTRPDAPAGSEIVTRPRIDVPSFASEEVELASRVIAGGGNLTVEGVKRGGKVIRNQMHRFGVNEEVGQGLGVVILADMLEQVIPLIEKVDTHLEEGATLPTGMNRTLSGANVLIVASALLEKFANSTEEQRAFSIFGSHNTARLRAGLQQLIDNINSEG